MRSLIPLNVIAPDQSKSWAEAILLLSAALAGVVPTIAGLYLVKSALGINVIAGPSPLHDLLYRFVV